MPPSQLTPPSGSSSISGIAVLENPRQQKDSPKTSFFDAHLFCPVDSLENNSDIENEGDQDKKTMKGILASLRYFNSRDLIFNDVDAYLITANMSFIFSLLNKMYIHLPTRSSRFLTPLPKIFQILHRRSWVTKITPWLGTLFLWVRFLFCRINNSFHFTAYSCTNRTCLQLFHHPCIGLPYHSSFWHTDLHAHIWPCPGAIHLCLQGL